MDKKSYKCKYARRTIMEDDESSRRPKFSTSTSGWISGKNKPIGDLNLVHGFLGISLKVSRESIKNNKPMAFKFRIINKTMYEPSLEGNDHRVYDVIQVYPKDYAFDPPAEMTIRLPSCVNQKTTGQVVCMFSNSFAVRNDTRFLQWGRVDSSFFIMNPLRTQAKILCKYSGFYTLILTQCPEVTSRISPRGLTVHVPDYPGIKIAYDAGCVDSDTKITIKVVCLEDLYNTPSTSPTSNDFCQRFTIQIPENADKNMLDVTGSPVVLVRPIRTKFRKPVKLSLPLLGNEFNGFFEKESNRLVVLRSTELEEERIIWHHHYSTPEIETQTNGKKIATFLITCGGLFKVVRRFSKKHMLFIEQVSNCIFRELCIVTSPDVMATSVLKGFITRIAEPGKQFVLRICLLDSTQPQNPDSCFVYKVCSQPLTVPLGKVRILVRGRFEPDRDVADHSEERTVMFTGKTIFVDFNLKLRLSDPTKLPETIGKVTVHSMCDMQYYITLQKPSRILKENQPGRGNRKPHELRRKKMSLGRHTESALDTSHEIRNQSQDAPESAIGDLKVKNRRQISSSFEGLSPRLTAVRDENEEVEEIEEKENEELEEESEDVVTKYQSTTGGDKERHHLLSSKSFDKKEDGSSDWPKDNDVTYEETVQNRRSLASLRYEEDEDSLLIDGQNNRKELDIDTRTHDYKSGCIESDTNEEREKQSGKSDAYAPARSIKDKTSYSSFASLESNESRSKMSQEKEVGNLASGTPSYCSLTSDSISIDSQFETRNNRLSPTNESYGG